MKLVKTLTIHELISFYRYERAKKEGTDSQIPQIGALPLAVPWILHYSHLSADECAENTVEAVKLTHPGPSLMPYVDKYARYVLKVLQVYIFWFNLID